MSRYPHTRLFSNPHRVVVLSGPHIQVLDTQSGRILFSTVNFAPEDEEAVTKSGPIRCSGMSQDGRYLATTGDDKQLKIWDLGSLTLMSARPLPKKPTSIEFSRDMDILVADKFGDVFRYALHPNNELFEAKSARNMVPSDENQLSGGELILGHASLLTTCLLTPDEEFIITADRDEHIRVSWYPKGYVIENYCLGHKKYVSAIHIPAASPKCLVSGGGDPELHVWDWMSGRLQRRVAVFATVEPFIVVGAQNQRGELLDDNCLGEESVNLGGGEGSAVKGKHRKLAALEPEDFEGRMPSEGLDKTSKTATGFVVRRISSFLSRSETHIVFSVVGGTAIFEFVLAETHDQLDIRHRDFGKPVIDFTVREDGTVWVLLDADFAEGSDLDHKHPRELVQVVRWSVDQFVDSDSSGLLDSLNTTCSLPATAEEFESLDLYADLSSLPKTVEGEQGSQVFGRWKPDRRHPEDEPTGKDAPAVVGLTKRALGRLKHKRALDQLHHDEVAGQDLAGPDTKKVKAKLEDENVHHGSM